MPLWVQAALTFAVLLLCLYTTREIARGRQARLSRRRRARVQAAGEAARLALLDRNRHRAEERKRQRAAWDEQVMLAKGITRRGMATLPEPDMYRVTPTQGWLNATVTGGPIYVTASIWESMTPKVQRRYVENALRARRAK